ncbi:SPOR domain-containing protein [Pseudoalteromonas sp. S16_S37]|uniref:SPOR domain-containing protein n=1 Tax=Pseudoalteromonas sp. S16_S37 TaxID=2720228 RepID=UPI0016817777|nr:SPOR domain-containing protein [Pseudoalteromonas sp. S16_S37]MBD1583838.1 AAA family ATPase [Pseudoalteromonas sp. S16_S37]
MQSQILPSRSALVDRIALQFEYGQNLICLVGSSGLGKSYIAESFITDKYPDFNKAYIQLSATTKDSDLMTQLLQHSFRGPLIDQQLSLSQNFYNLYRQSPCGPCLWVLDGARHLTDEMIEQLQILAKECPETLYILVTAQAPNMLRDALDIHIEPLSMAESRRLMDMFFKQLPPLEDPIFHTFLRGCAGNPAVLLEWQSEQQVDLRATPKKATKLSWHLVLLTVILAMLMIAFIYQKELTALLPEPEENSQLNTVIPATKAVNDDQKAEVPLTDGPAEVSKPVTVEDETQKQVESEVEHSANEQNGLVKQQDVAAIVSALANDSTVKEIVAADSNVETKAIPAAAEAVAEQLLEGAEQPPQPVIETKKQSAQVDSKETNALPTGHVDMLDDGAWLMAREDSEWAVQLLAVKDKAVAQEFIEQHKLDNVKIYKANRSSQIWWIIILGPFSSLELAQEAKSTLPAQILSGQPFFKKVDKIKQEISLPTR